MTLRISQKITGVRKVSQEHSGAHALGVFAPPDPPRYRVRPDDPPATIPLSLLMEVLELLRRADTAGAFGACAERGRVLVATGEACGPCVAMETLMWVARVTVDEARRGRGAGATLEADVWGKAAAIALRHRRAHGPYEGGAKPPGDCE